MLGWLHTTCTHHLHAQQAQPAACTCPPRAWLMSCTWPVMRATCALLVAGVHRNMVWSSEPLTSRSGCPLVTAS